METPLPLPADATPKPKAQVLAETLIPGQENAHWHTRIQWVVIFILAWQCPQLVGPLAAWFGVPVAAMPQVSRPAGRLVAMDPATGKPVPTAAIVSADPITGRVVAVSTNGGLTWTTEADLRATGDL